MTMERRSAPGEFENHNAFIRRFPSRRRACAGLILHPLSFMACFAMLLISSCANE